MPTQGILGPGETLQCAVEFCPQRRGISEGEMTVVYETGESAHTYLKGESHEVDAGIDTNSVKMLPTFVTRFSQKNLKLENNTDKPVRFAWKVGRAAPACLGREAVAREGGEPWRETGPSWGSCLGVLCLSRKWCRRPSRARGSSCAGASNGALPLRPTRPTRPTAVICPASRNDMRTRGPRAALAGSPEPGAGTGPFHPPQDAGAPCPRPSELVLLPCRTRRRMRMTWQ